MQIVECVPNISEGRRAEVYHAVADAAGSAPGVTLLNVDPGADTNRTVITFVGEPEAVLEGAFRLVKKGLELIDMTVHRGAHPRIGAVDIGARKFLVAYNVNLNTLDKRLATRVAFDVRERGRMKRDAEGNPILGADGQPEWEPGLLKSVKAVGWVIPEFGCAQVSINLTDLDITPLHVAFDTCEERARERGLRVTGSEIVGLVPLSVLLAAGRHYLARMGRPTGVPEAALVHSAIRTLGLSELKPLDPRERVIEYSLAAP